MPPRLGPRPSSAKEERQREGQSATDDYVAKQKADRANMGKLREQRLAAEAKATSDPKLKPKRKGKAKR
jgi:hypothetical protein